ncbi:MAG: T9SS type A sorting domain-containing protein, partial [Bacteroidia bacterium]|nr:T9SS type A sorting domain-containing protein [Bacteroidia bacterium]
TPDSSVSMNNGGSFTAPLKLSWATASWYNANYTQLIKQNVYGYWTGALASFHTSYFYYSPTIDSNIFYSGASPSSALILSLRRFTYKNTSGAFDSIIDKYYNDSNVNTQTITWKFLYNVHGNLINWKYVNPSYTISNKEYKLFYTGASNKVDSLQYYNNGYYTSTHVYSYGANNEWSSIAYKPDYNSATYANGIQSYNNSFWSTEFYCDSIASFYYYPATQLNQYSTINNYTSTGYIDSKLLSNYKTKYNYNITNGPNAIANVNTAITNIYPNPATDVVTISTSIFNDKATLIITNVLGQIVLQQALINTTTQVNVRSLIRGVYFVTINNSTTQKLIVE